jgi:hypothetical protein
MRTINAVTNTVSNMIQSNPIHRIRDEKLAEIRTVNYIANYEKAKDFNQVKEARVNAAKAQAQADLDVQFYKAKAKHEAADARSQQAYRSYQGAYIASMSKKENADNRLKTRAMGTLTAQKRSTYRLNAVANERTIQFEEMAALYANK